MSAHFPYIIDSGNGCRNFVPIDLERIERIDYCKHIECRLYVFVFPPVSSIEILNKFLAYHSLITPESLFYSNLTLIAPEFCFSFEKSRSDNERVKNASVEMHLEIWYSKMIRKNFIGRSSLLFYILLLRRQVIQY